MKWPYEAVGRCFDGLFEKWQPWEGEVERCIFRTNWLEALETMGWTEVEWEEELALRIEILQMSQGKLVRFKEKE